MQLIKTGMAGILRFLSQVNNHLTTSILSVAFYVGFFSHKCRYLVQFYESFLDTNALNGSAMMDLSFVLIFICTQYALSVFQKHYLLIEVCNTFVKVSGILFCCVVLSCNICAYVVYTHLLIPFLCI